VGGKQKGERTAVSRSLSAVAAGLAGSLICGARLDNPGASASPLQIIGWALPWMRRTGSLPHFVTVLEGMHTVLQGTLRVASIINNSYDFFSIRL